MTFAISVCKAFLTGMICADAEKINKIKVRVAVSGFIKVEF
jgi:hypothetical protein